MNQKNYFFLICFLGMASVIFAMENNTVISYGNNRCSFLSFSVLFNTAYTNLTTDQSDLPFSIDFFSSFTKEDGAREDLSPFMNDRQSPLFFIIKKIAELRESLNGPFDQHSPSDNIQKDIIVTLISEHFEILKLLCSSCPLFFADAWQTKEATPCSFSMEKEVQLLLAHNASPAQQVTEKNVRHNTGAAQALHYQSIVALLNSGDKEEVL